MIWSSRMVLASPGPPLTPPPSSSPPKTPFRSYSAQMSWIDLSEPDRSTTVRWCATSDWRGFGRRSKTTRWKACSGVTASRRSREVSYPWARGSSSPVSTIKSSDILRESTKKTQKMYTIFFKKYTQKCKENAHNFFFHYYNKRNTEKTTKMHTKCVKITQKNAKKNFTYRF